MESGRVSGLMYPKSILPAGVFYWQSAVQGAEPQDGDKVYYTRVPSNPQLANYVVLTTALEALPSAATMAMATSEAYSPTGLVEETLEPSITTSTRKRHSKKSPK